MSELSNRFRRASVSAPASAVERLRRKMDEDGKVVYDLVATELRTMVRDPAQRGTELLELFELLATHPDEQRVYAAYKLAATWLVESSRVPGDADEPLAWTAWFDLAAALLVPYLERHPHEPELVNLLGLCYYELGDVAAARRLFEAVKAMEPEHMLARRNLRACKQRTASGGVKPVPARLAPYSTQYHASAKRIAEAASRLAPGTISLCMIVKNEEEMLPGCLTAAAPYVDEIIVVDTGSTDRTREIALEHGAKVVDFEWTGSFSDARNRSIEDATGDWILYLDADEHLVDGDGRQLKTLTQKTWIEAFYLVETHFTGAMELGQQTTHMAMRMFRRRPQYSWQHIIHEQLLWSFPTYLPERFANTGVRIDHYGYLRAVIDDRGKRERNLELLIQQAGEQTTAFTEFNIGSEYAAMHEWQLARPHFEQALALERDDPTWTASQFAPMLVSRLAIARRSTGAFAETIELIEEALGFWPDFTDLVYERAVVELGLNHTDEAERQLQHAIELGDAPAKYVSVGGKGSYQARALLAKIASSRGDTDRARTLLREAIEEAPFFLGNVFELADLELASGKDADVVEQELGELLTSDGPSTNLFVAAIFAERGHLDHAERGYAKVLSAAPDNAAALIGLAELRLAQHRFADAIELTAQVPADHPWAARAARTEFLAGVVDGSPGATDRALGILTSAADVPDDERAFYASWARLLAGGGDPDAAEVQPDATLANLEALAKLHATDEFERLVPLLERALPDERTRRMQLGQLYMRRRFVDMAGNEFLICAQRFGPQPDVLTALGKVATMKEMWSDARNFLNASLEMQPGQPEAERLLALISDR